MSEIVVCGKLRAKELCVTMLCAARVVCVARVACERTVCESVVYDKSCV